MALPQLPAHAPVPAVSVATSRKRTLDTGGLAAGLRQAIKLQGVLVSDSAHQRILEDFGSRGAAGVLSFLGRAGGQLKEKRQSVHGCPCALPGEGQPSASAVILSYDHKQSRVHRAAFQPFFEPDIK